MGKSNISLKYFLSLSTRQLTRRTPIKSLHGQLQADWGRWAEFDFSLNNLHFDIINIQLQLKTERQDKKFGINSYHEVVASCSGDEI